MAKLLVAAGTRDIPVGTPMAILVEDAKHVAAFADYQAGQSGAESKPEPEAKSGSSGEPCACLFGDVTASVTAAACLMADISLVFMVCTHFQGLVSIFRLQK